MQEVSNIARVKSVNKVHVFQFRLYVVLSRLIGISHYSVITLLRLTHFKLCPGQNDNMGAQKRVRPMTDTEKTYVLICIMPYSIKSEILIIHFLFNWLLLTQAEAITRTSYSAASLEWKNTSVYRYISCVRIYFSANVIRTDLYVWQVFFIARIMSSTLTDWPLGNLNEISDM